MSIIEDIRIAARALMKAKAFSLVAITTLALAIGANTAIFSVVDGVLLRPLPYPTSEQLVSVSAAVLPQAAGSDEAPFSDRGFWHFANNNRAFAAFGGYTEGTEQWPLTGDGAPVQLDIAQMTTSAFEVLGVYPVRGRFPSAEEDSPDGPSVGLISNGLWVDRFGADPDIIGTVLQLNGEAREVVGVMPPGYDFPTPEVDVWVPQQLDPASENLAGHYLGAVARLRPGVTIDAAIRDAEALISRFPEIGYGPRWFEGVFSGRANVVTLKEQLVGDSRRPLLILLGTVGFVLLIACSNVANLLLVRAESRTRERAVRIALGSGRARLVQYVLTESVLLSLVGGLLGILLAFVGTEVLVNLAPAGVPRVHEIGINGNALLFTLIVSMVAGLLFGAFPGLRAGSKQTLTALRDGGRGSTIGRDRHRVRDLLVVTQVGLALILLVGSGLMARSFQALNSVNPGFDADGVMTFRLSPPLNKYPVSATVVQFYDELLEKLSGIGGGEAVGGITNLPMSGGGPILVARIDDYPLGEDEFPPSFLARRATPGYFSAMGIPVVEGREFIPDDHHARLGSIIISESVQREYWPDESPLGKRITIQGAPARVVGVVGDVHDAALETAPEMFAYKPMLDSVRGGVRPMMMVVRTEGDPTQLVAGIREAVEELDPQLPITDLMPMSSLVADSMSRTSFTMSLLLLAAAIALFLGAVGIYGVLSYVASQRTAEMGVRFALGADAGHVRKIILLHGMTLAGGGVGVGLLGAVGLSGLLESLLFEVSPLDPATLVSVAVLFLVVAAAASAVPAERAARTPPAVALRAD